MASYSPYGRREIAASFDELASVEFAERILGPADNMLQFDLELNSSVRDRLPYMLGSLRTGGTLAIFLLISALLWLTVFTVRLLLSIQYSGCSDVV